MFKEDSKTINENSEQPKNTIKPFVSKNFRKFQSL